MYSLLVLILNFWYSLPSVIVHFHLLFRRTRIFVDDSPKLVDPASRRDLVIYRWHVEKFVAWVANFAPCVLVSGSMPIKLWPNVRLFGELKFRRGSQALLINWKIVNKAVPLDFLFFVLLSTFFLSLVGNQFRLFGGGFAEIDSFSSLFRYWKL